MTTNVNSSKVLASLRLEEQDVIHASSRVSICEALIQMAKSTIENKLKYLVEIPRDCLVGENNKCKCYPNAVCEEWTLDEDDIRSNFYEGDYGYVTDYVIDLFIKGPIGYLCLWIGDYPHECVWGKRNSEKFDFKCPKCNGRLTDYEIDKVLNESMMICPYCGVRGDPHRFIDDSKWVAIRTKDRVKIEGQFYPYLLELKGDCNSE